MSSSKARRGRSGRIFLVLVMVLGLAFSALPVLGQDAALYEVPDSFAAQIAVDKAERPYVVMMAGDPAVAYDGGIQGYKATKPAKDEKINPNSGAVKRYLRYLNDQHAGALNGVGVGLDKKFADYNISFNGFAAMLTGAEVAALLESDDVLYAWEDELRQLTTDYSDDYLRMADAWDSDLIGGEGLAGEDIIIGVIDTGIDPNHPSFSDQIDLSSAPAASARRNLAYDNPPSYWSGVCQQGEQWSHKLCNNKLIGARYFHEGFSKFEINFSGDYLSARDFDGHGTHTASTAGGNRVPTVLPNGDETTMVGMAPRARIAVYKACWADAGCAGSDLVHAIDQAVADGVDVINYSIGSPAQSVSGPDDIAFLFAADAGVFVATSNGNDGPGANTTGSPSSSPWVTSVGAGQHGRNFLGEVTLGDGSEYSGASVSSTEVAGTLVDSAAAVLDPTALGDDGTTTQGELCYPGQLDPSVVSGHIVLCRRGDIARVDKSLAVSIAGGIGMIMYNPSGNSLNADTHSVPSIHVDHIAGPAIKAYASSPDPVATIHVGGTYGVVDPDVVAGFSSRGLGFSSDIVKPDILAPGVNIWAAAPRHTFFGQFKEGAQFLSGTSMASPHLAGIGALVKQAHPDWSPAMIKSALMTTADPTGLLKEDIATPATAFDRGSGLVQPGSAFDPGLVYDADLFDYAAFTCAVDAGVFTPGSCVFLSGIGYPTDEPSDLNQPNIAIGELAGTQTVVRRVTNVAGGTHTYEAFVDAPSGVDVVVSPEELTLAPGETGIYAVSFTTNETATVGEYTFGSLTWSHGPHNVTSQLAIRPVQAAFPAGVRGEGTDGSLSFYIDFGYGGDYTAAAHGLVPAMTEDGNVLDDPANDINAALGTCDFSSFPYQCTGITWHLVEVPVGSAYAQFSLFDAYTDGADDLDLYVWGPGDAFFGGSGSGTSAEQVSGLFPEPGTYEVAVHGWQTDGPDSNYTLFSWAFGPPEGNMTVAGPVAAVLGATETVTVDWSGLDADLMYLGAVSHSDDGGIFGLTLVEIDS